MTQSELIESLAAQQGITTKEATSWLNALVTTVNDALANDEKVDVANLGSFNVCTRAARIKTDRKTGEKTKVPACKTVQFRMADALKDQLEATLR